MSRIHRHGFARVDPVLTPLIDLGFLLTVFFAVVSHIASSDAAPLELPRPRPSAAGDPGRQPRAVINVIADESGALATYRYGGIDYPPTADGRGALAETLAQVLREMPGAEFSLRADRRLPWRAIAPIFEAVSRSAAVATPGRPARLRLVVLEESSR